MARPVTLFTGQWADLEFAELAPKVKEMGYDVQERDVDRSEFYDASEAFFCGTGWEVTPLNEVDGSSVGDGKPGEITQALQKVYFDLVNGVSDDNRGWLTEV